MVTEHVSHEGQPNSAMNHSGAGEFFVQHLGCFFKLVLLLAESILLFVRGLASDHSMQPVFVLQGESFHGFPLNLSGGFLRAEVFDDFCLGQSNAITAPSPALAKGLIYLVSGRKGADFQGRRLSAVFRSACSRGNAAGSAPRADISASVVCRYFCNFDQECQDLVSGFPPLGRGRGHEFGFPRF